MSVLARPVGDSFQRGIKLAAAHPGLIAVQLGATLVALVSTLLSILLLALAFLPFLPALLGSAAPSLPAPFSRFLPDDGLGAPSLGLAVVALVVALLLGGFVLAVSAWVKAGIVGVLVEADAAAPPSGPVAAFRIRRAGAFGDSARRLFVRFFGLLNLVLGVGMLVALSVGVGILVFALALARERPVLGIAALLATIAAAIVSAVSLRLVDLACQRAIAADDLPLLDGIAAGLKRLTRTLGPSLLLFLLVVAASGAVGIVLALPRVFLQAALSSDTGLFGPLLLVIAVGGLVEMVVYTAIDVAQSGAFVALWGAAAHPHPPLPVRLPPVAFLNTVLPPPPLPAAADVPPAPGPDAPAELPPPSPDGEAASGVPAPEKASAVPVEGELSAGPAGPRPREE